MLSSAAMKTVSRVRPSLVQRVLLSTEKNAKPQPTYKAGSIPSSLAVGVGLSAATLAVLAITQGIETAVFGKPLDKSRWPPV